MKSAFICLNRELKLLFQKIQTYLSTLEFRFIVVGGFNTLFGYLVFTLCLSATNGTIWLSLACSFCAGVALSYVTQLQIVFKASGIGYLPNYILLYTSLYILNLASLHLLNEIFGVSYILSQAFLTPVTAILSFVGLSRLFLKNEET